MILLYGAFTFLWAILVVGSVILAVLGLLITLLVIIQNERYHQDPDYVYESIMKPFRWVIYAAAGGLLAWALVMVVPWLVQYFTSYMPGLG